MKNKLTSRKFWAALLTAVFMLVSALTGLDLDTEEMLSIVLPVVAYILGESWVDGRRRAK